MHPANPKSAEALARGRAALEAAADRRAANVLPVIRELQASGTTSLNGIATALNDRGIKTARGREWRAGQVGRVLARAV